MSNIRWTPEIREALTEELGVSDSYANLKAARMRLRYNDKRFTTRVVKSACNNFKIRVRPKHFEEGFDAESHRPAPMLTQDIVQIASDIQACLLRVRQLPCVYGFKIAPSAILKHVHKKFLQYENVKLSRPLVGDIKHILAEVHGTALYTDDPEMYYVMPIECRGVMHLSALD